MVLLTTTVGFASIVAAQSLSRLFLPLLGYFSSFSKKPTSERLPGFPPNGGADLTKLRKVHSRLSDLLVGPGKCPWPRPPVSGVVPRVVGTLGLSIIFFFSNDNSLRICSFIDCLSLLFGVCRLYPPRNAAGLSRYSTVSSCSRGSTDS